MDHGSMATGAQCHGGSGGVGDTTECKKASVTARAGDDEEETRDDTGEKGGRIVFPLPPP